MRTLLLSLFAVALIARPAGAGPDEDARAALALARHLPPQAPLPQQAPAVTHACHCSGPGDCSCGVGTCACQNCLAAYEWYRFADDARQLALFLNGKQIGGYDLIRAVYRPVNAATAEWGKPCQPPTLLPSNLKTIPTRRPPLTLEFAPQSFAPPAQSYGVWRGAANCGVGG